MYLTLVDYNTGTPLSPDDLDLSEDEYDAALACYEERVEFDGCDSVLVRGRRVYAE